MKKSFMNNIKSFVDSNVRQRIDRAANNNNDFFGDDLLLLERQFEDIRLVCSESEKRISAMLLSLSTSAIGAYTQNVHASLNNLSSLTTNAVTTSVANSVPPASNIEQQALTCSQVSSSSSRAKLTTLINSNEQPATSSNNSGNHMNQSSSNNSNTTNEATNETLKEDIRRHKKLPIVGFLKFLAKSCYKLKQDSLLATTLTHCSQLQAQLTKLYLFYEQTIESQILKPIQHVLEIDAPNIVKLRKLFIKSHNDLDSLKAKYNGAIHKSQQQQLQSGHFTSTSYTISQSNAQQANINKLDQLKKELDDAMTRTEQARDIYATELYAFVCRETELVNLFMKFYQYQADYHLQVGSIIQNSLPTLSNILANTPRKVVFGIPLEEHLRCTGRSVSLVIELCVHLLYSNALNEEGLFRVPGSSSKIKKLKSAINAWFVTLAGQTDLEFDQEQQLAGNQQSVIAIYDLFKDIVGLRPQQSTTIVGGDTIGNNRADTRDESTFTSQANTSATHDQQLVFDVHTIAGLLKLYLRELPEPLFTYALYGHWIDATVRNMNGEQPITFEQVIKQLPKANYDNLRYLIRFLHLLTCHREFNKMTAANLAITMAPSLIWSPPSDPKQSLDQASTTDNRQDDLRSLNMQMSSVGISASLHALVIENLINHAEDFLPGPINFSLPALTECYVSTSNQGQHQSRHGRTIKPNSPTCLSAASSSSFSSASNASVTSSMTKGHDRKGGSMDGLLNESNFAAGDANRPLSVIVRQELNHHHQPPPVPPAPKSRSHSRHTSDFSCQNRMFSNHKSQAPPVPPPSSPRDQARQQRPTNSQPEISVVETRTLSAQTAPNVARVAPASLRGTGSLSSVGSSSVTRPSVPPPSRPSKPSIALDQTEGPRTQRTRSEESDTSQLNIDTLSSRSLASVNLRADYEEISPVDVDDIDISVSVSPVASFDGISGDSSFDDECHSLGHSWADCDVEHVQNESATKRINNIDNYIVQESIPDSKTSETTQTLSEPQTNERRKVEGARQDEEESSTSPPVKPPRSISPKIAQSTPL